MQFLQRRQPESEANRKNTQKKTKTKYGQNEQAKLNY